MYFYPTNKAKQKNYKKTVWSESNSACKILIHCISTEKNNKITIENKNLRTDDKETAKNAIEEFLFPEDNKLPEDAEMFIWEHMDELRERIVIAGVTWEN